jgi:hypothetical protein
VEGAVRVDEILPLTETAEKGTRGAGLKRALFNTVGQLISVRPLLPDHDIAITKEAPGATVLEEGLAVTRKVAAGYVWHPSQGIVNPVEAETFDTPGVKVTPAINNNTTAEIIRTGNLLLNISGLCLIGIFNRRPPRDIYKHYALAILNKYKIQQTSY